MNNKTDTIGLFLSPINGAYIMSVLPKSVTRSAPDFQDILMQAMHNFMRENQATINNLQPSWKSLRYLNKLFISSWDPNVINQVNTTYSSFGEGSFMTNQVKYGDLYNVARVCKSGTPYKYLDMPNDLNRDPAYRHAPKPARIRWGNSVRGSIGSMRQF